MSKNSDNARAYGSIDDFVAIGEVGEGATLVTALPTTLPKEAPSPFTEVGWLGEDGINLAPDDSVEKLKGFQGGRTIRTIVTSSDTSFKFTALESSAMVMGLFLDYKDTKKQGKLTINKLGGREVIAKSFVVGVRDGNVIDWYIIDNGEIGERSEVNLGSSELVGWEFTVTVIGDWWHVREELDATPVTP